MAISDADIKTYIQQVFDKQGLTDIQRAEAIRNAALQNGVSNDQIAAATGYSIGDVNAYLSKALLANQSSGAPATANLGLGGALSPDDRTAVINKATEVGKLQGITPQQALYNYAQTNHLSNSQVDNYMGFNPGETDTWAKQNNLGLGGAQPAAPTTTQSNRGEYTPNPYLKDIANGITTQMTDNWTRNLAPSIRSGAMAAGGFGGSRQGVVEANGLKDLNTTLGANLANLYGQDYNNSMNRNLSYDQLDSSNAQFGANFGLNALNSQNNWANNNLLTANALQNAPIDYNKYFTNTANSIAGQGGTSTSTTNNQGNVAASALGGAMAGGSLYKNLTSPYTGSQYQMNMSNPSYYGVK